VGGDPEERTQIRTPGHRWRGQLVGRSGHHSCVGPRARSPWKLRTPLARWPLRTD